MAESVFKTLYKTFGGGALVLIGGLVGLLGAFTAVFALYEVLGGMWINIHGGGIPSLILGALFTLGGYKLAGIGIKIWKTVDAP